MAGSLRLELFTPQAADSIASTLAYLFEHVDPVRTVVVGSVAMAQFVDTGKEKRQLYDVDVCVPSLDVVAPTLSYDFAIAHLHFEDQEHRRPYLPIVDRDTGLKVDVFCPEAMPESGVTANSNGIEVRLIGPDHVFVANVISIELQMERGKIKQQRVDDVDRVLPFVDRDKAEKVWHDIWRRDGSVFRTLDEARQLLEARPELFVLDEFPGSMEPDCSDCFRDARFPLAEYDEVMTLLSKTRP